MSAHDQPDCPPGVHPHPIRLAVLPDAHVMVIDVNTGVLAAVTDKQWAQRIAELVNRHGIADVPDDCSALTAPWPPPSGAPADPTSAAGVE